MADPGGRNEPCGQSVHGVPTDPPMCGLAPPSQEATPEFNEPLSEASDGHTVGRDTVIGQPPPVDGPQPGALMADWYGDTSSQVAADPLQCRAHALRDAMS